MVPFPIITPLFALGLLGSFVLVTGAALPEGDAKHPSASAKNWFFAIGGLLMFFYSLFSYLGGGPVFFVFLGALAVIASVFMMLNISDTIGVPVIAATGLWLVIWSLTLFQDYKTLFFIVGLCGIGAGYAFQTGSLRREVALCLGSLLIAIFSYVEHNWIFFWLNTFFAVFSGMYCLAMLKKQR